MKRVLFSAVAAAGLSAAAPALAAGCSLGNGIKHVVYLQFDNTHFIRDNANVPSDLEQMPNLLNFMKTHGVVLSNDHTQLISHTSNGLITSMTGVYSDRTGAAAISNSFSYYNADTKIAAYADYSSSFVYWPDTLSGDTSPGADRSYVLIDQQGKNAPAPWVAYTRAGCDFAAAGIADLEFENTTTDVATAFGPSSAEYAFTTNKSNSESGTSEADFEGVAIHCARNSVVCAAADKLTTVQPDGLPLSRTAPDALPQEPDGYTGYEAIFGHRYALPAVQSVLGEAKPGLDLNDLQGNLIGYQTAVGGQIIQSDTIPGFPGFDGMFPWVTLAYTEEFLKAGIPVVYGYFSDAHDHQYGVVDGVNPAGSTFAYGPGEQGYTNKLKLYDQAWGTFFSDLSAAGIDDTNTLFVILVEEGDRFAGGKPTPADCDGVTVACTYPPNAYTDGRPAKGEVDVNIDALLAQQRNDTTPFTAHTDQSTGYYLNGEPAPTAPVARTFARDVAALTYNDPYLNNALVPVTTALADPAELSILHMITGDPLRTPTLIGFNNDDVYGGTGAVTYGRSNPTCGATAATALPVCTYAGYAWNHGGIQAAVRQTWTSMAGPGIKPTGVDPSTWTDHTDVRATMFALLRLQDDYLHDGRVVVENLDPTKLPATISGNVSAYEQLATTYKQLTAPFGEASTASLRYSTAAISSDAPNDATYATYLSNVTAWVASRNTVAGEMRALLNDAEQGTSFNASQVAGLVSQANALISQMVAWSN
jgi:hypothetical protein